MGDFGPPFEVLKGVHNTLLYSRALPDISEEEKVTTHTCSVGLCRVVREKKRVTDE